MLSIPQYIEYDEKVKQEVETILPKETVGAFRMMYIEIANKFKDAAGGGNDEPTTPTDEGGIDYQLELFATEIVDWEYIVRLVEEYVKNRGEKKRYSKESIVNMIKSDPVYANKSELVGEFIDYAEENNFFKNVTEAETFTEIEKFAQSKENEHSA